MPNYNFNHKEETKKRVSESKKGEKNNFYGKHHSEETKKRISQKLRGRVFSLEHKKKISNKLKGMKIPLEIRKKMGEKRKELIREGKIKIRKGFKLTKEHIEKVVKTRKEKIRKGLLNPTKNLGIYAKGMVGEKNFSWKGGLSFEPYTKEFNKRFKKEIRKRDNQICMLCGIHREKLKRTLSIHHINYDKKLTIPENCLSLCMSCHTKTGWNRKHWTNFFQSLLSEKYGYEYEDSQPIIKLELNKEVRKC